MTRTPGQGVLAVCTRVLGAAWLVAALACEGSGELPATRGPEGYRAGLAHHKVQLSAEQAKQLEQSGVSARVLGDYGSFQLVEVDDAALGSLPTGAEGRDSFNDLLLNAGVIDTASAHGQSLRGMNLPASGKRLHIVQFVGPIQEAWVQELEATGVRLITYVPNNAYIVYGDGASLSRLQRHISSTRAIQWNGDYLNDYKLDPSIQTSQTPAYNIQLIQDEEANSPTLDLIRARQSRDGTIREALGYVNVVAYLTVKDLYEIAAHPDVLSIQPRSEPHKQDERQDLILAGRLTSNGLMGPGYLAWLASKGFTQAQFNASGFAVDVSDDGIDNGTTTPNHFGLYEGGNISSASRIIYNRIEGTGSSTEGCDGHGNLNAHIIAGYTNKTGAPFQDAEGYAYGLGVAPFVKVGGSVVFGPDWTSPVYEDLQSRAYRDGARISSNSWGYSGLNTYNIDCQQYDSLVRDAQQAGHAEPNTPGNQEMVIVFSAGNVGSGANTVMPPGTAKNVITVGASENIHPFGGADQCGFIDTDADSANDLGGFSSRGPSLDGRKKPDLIAPGTHISGGAPQDAAQRAEPPAFPLGKVLSCFEGNDYLCGGTDGAVYPPGQEWYTASTGTSHSAPAVSGGAALVRQYFINQGVAPPSAAMTKAYLMNSARYLTGAGANDTLWSNNQGMGSMDLGRAFDGVPRQVADEIESTLFTASGQIRSISAVVADTTQPLRVTLAWTDAPGSTTGSAWKNNLDLAVTVGANTYKGNVFAGANSVTGGTSDDKNNVESVFLPAGTEGAYTVTITAANINSDGVPGNASALDQDFALVVYNSCTAAPPAAPTGVTATANGNNRVDVSWTENGADSYNIYRAATAGGPYTRVGSATAPPFADTTVSGGVTSYYVVRAVQCAESAKSSEASATPSGVCALPPTFAGLAAATNGLLSTCTNTLTWPAASPSCGGTVSYSIYRSTSQGFTPSVNNRIATGRTGTSFNDDLALANGTTYYYVVRATEVSSATLEDTNTVKKSATPTGAPTTGLHYFDDLDANRPPNAGAYWIGTYTGPPEPIKIISNCHYQSATNAYSIGSAACLLDYTVNTQAILSLGGNGTIAGINGFAIPTNTDTAQLKFNLWYSTEYRYDGLWLAYSTTSAAGPWDLIADSASSVAPYISSGGYDTVLDGSGGPRAWTGQNMGANGALKAVTVNLRALAGHTAWFSFQWLSDAGVTDKGTFVDDVRIDANAYALCSTQTPPPGPAAVYKLTGLPASAPAGTATPFTLTAFDALGLQATGYNGTAAFTSSDPQAVLPASVTFSAGVATGSVSFRSLGSQTLTATDTSDTTLTGSASTSVTVGPAAALVILTQPSSATAGVAIAPAVRVGLVDQFGNPVTTGTPTITLALGNNPGGGTLSGTTTVTAINGLATFSNLSIDKTGAGYTLVASASGLTSATSSVFNVTPGPATTLVFQTQPSDTSVGGAISPAVQVAIQDAFGNLTASTANVTLALANNPNGATLAGTTTVAAVGGIASFGNLSLNKTGTGYTLAASAQGLTGATSSAFNVIVGVPYRVAITRQPTNTVAGSPITPSVQVTVLDAAGNPVTQATTAISVTLGNNPSGGTLSGTTTINAMNGVATFADLSVNRVGVNYTLTASSSGLFADTSVSFNVTAGAATQLVFTESPSANVASGAPFTAKLEVRDAGGNLVTSASSSVTLALTSAAGATLSGTTVVTAVNGVATFTGLSVDKVGSGYQLQATATGLTSATSPAFGVNPGAAASLTFLTQPGNVGVGATIAPPVRVSIHDAAGNVVSTATNSVTLALASNPSGATLGGTTTVAAINGVATFDTLSINRAGTGYTLSATSGSLTGATSSAFDAQAASAVRVVFTQAPTSTTAGSNLGTVSVEFRDAQGNRVSTTSNVTLTLQGGQGGTLSGTATVAAVAGVATFSDLSIAHAGTGYQLVAHASGLTDDISPAFDISHGPAAALVFSGQPGSTQAGTAITPAVRVVLQDAFGNVATSATESVTVALGNNPNGGTLSGTLTVSASSGVATFSDLSINRIGKGYTLQASAGALPPVTSAAFDITPGKAPKLVFRTTLSQVSADANLPSIEVELRDELDNLLTDTAATVVLSLGTNPTGGQLLGTTTVSADKGVAKFDGLSLRKAGEGYTLVASSQGITSATSTAFTVKPGAAASYTLTLVSSATVGQELTLFATASDAYGNLAVDYGGATKVTSSDAKASFAANAQFAQGALQGFKVTFKSQGVQTLTVTDSEKSSLTATVQLNVVPVAAPTVSVTEPAGGTVVSGNVTISATGSVAQSTTLVKLAILVDGVEIVSGTESTVTGTWDSSQAEPGAHVITAQITDGEGNAVTSAPVIVTVRAGNGNGNGDGDGDGDESGCGCGATSGTDASIYLGLLLLARYALGRGRSKVA